MKKRFSLFIGVIAFVMMFSITTHADAATNSYERISGKDRISTAIEMSKLGWPLGLDGGNQDVILARADNPIDALAASYLAGYLDAPILLTYPNQIRQDVLDEMSRLNTEEVYIVGGTSAISSGIEGQLKDLGYIIHRAGKKDRYYTAAIINSRADAHSSTKALIVNGSRVADAVSAASEAALNKVPVYLATKDTLPIEMPESIKDVVLYGGTSVISEKLENSLKTQGYNVTRKSGTDRYKTNVEALASLSPTERALLVRGTSTSSIKEDYPDAVAAAGLAARLNAHIMISDNDSAISDIKAFLQSNYQKVFVIGGKAAIQLDVMEGLNLTNEMRVEDNTLSMNALNPYFSLDNKVATDLTSLETINNVMEGLFRIGPDHELVPGVAKSYEANADYTEFIFHLRKDAKWSDNRPVIADDFVSTWRNTLHPYTNSVYSYLMQDIKNAKAIQDWQDPLYATTQELGVSAVDDYTLKVELESSVPYFAYNTAHPVFFPQPRWVYLGSEYGSDQSNTYYNGPFILSEWEKDGKWTYKKNELYWDHLNVNLSEIHVQVTEDSNRALNLFETDQIDLAVMDEVNNEISSNPDYFAKLEPITFFIHFNHEKPELQNTKLRKALSTSIDRKKIVDQGFNGEHQAATYLVPKEFTYNGTTDFRNVYPSFDISTATEAQQLWSDAKSELGVSSLELELLVSENGSSIGQLIKSEMESKLPGLTINVTSPSFSQMLGKATSGDFDLYFTGWGADFRDPSDFLKLFATDSSYNYGSYSNSQYNGLVEDMLSADRWTNLQNAEKLIIEDEAGIIPVYQLRTPYLQKGSLSGIVRESAGIRNLQSFKWTSKE